MKINRELMSLESIYQLSKFPDSILEGDLINKKIFGDSELSYYKGIEENEFRFIIRKFLGPPELVCEYITIERTWFNNDYFSYSKLLYGFYTEENPTSILYVLITEKCGQSFSELARNWDESLKIEALGKLGQILFEMQKHGIYNVGLNKDFIYFTEKREVLIGDNFWIIKKINKQNISKIIPLANKKILSPELRLLTEIENKVAVIDNINFLYSSTFSFGLLCLSMFNIKANINLQTKNHMSWFRRIFDLPIRSKDKPEITYSSNIEERIDNQFLKDIIILCLNIISSERCDYEKISLKLNVSRDEIEKIIRPNLIIQTENIEEENITDRELEQSCDYFVDTISKIHTICDSYNYELKKVFGGVPPHKIIRKPTDLKNEELIQFQVKYEKYDNLRVVIASKVRTYTSDRFDGLLRILKKGHDLFYASRCDSENIKFKEGLVSFFYAFHKDMSFSLECDEELIDAIIEHDSIEPEYNKIIKNFLGEKNVTKKETYLFGLISLTYQKDWYHFFPVQNQNYLCYKLVGLLSQNAALMAKIKNFLMKKTILKMLAKYLENNSTSFGELKKINEKQNLKEEKYEVNLEEEKCEENLEEKFEEAFSGEKKIKKNLLEKEKNEENKLEEIAKKEKTLDEIANSAEFANIITKALNRVYVLQMQPSLYGLTTFNQKILVSPFYISLKPPKSDSQAAMLLTIFHELAHYIRRINCKTYADSRAIYTPKNDKIQKEDLSGMSEYDYIYSRREAGNDAELQLLGKKMETINESAGNFLFEGDLSNLENFQIQLFNENKKKGESKTNIGKSNFHSVSFFGLKCGVSHR
ncbi:hypothetical protein SteCoe_24101 [Stentor coeruleus]|uniref:Protein kinase domain-containing protein n=1 Tax=Stentor coeruleus TaxID=5963 RepID=A0A1R2BIH5_9CILI|nr:hypothetical protein SteCoe_24101 [Stentor coeruleus]